MDMRNDVMQDDVEMIEEVSAEQEHEASLTTEFVQTATTEEIVDAILGV